MRNEAGCDVANTEAEGGRSSDRALAKAGLRTIR